MGGCGHRHGAGNKRTSQKVNLVQGNRDNKGLGGGQRRLNFRDSSIGEQTILDSPWKESRGYEGGEDGDFEVQISGDWVDADDMNQDKNCKGRNRFGQKPIYRSHFSLLPRWRWKWTD